MLKQLSVFVENQKGSLAKVTTALKENNINIRAIASFDSPEFGILRLIVDEPQKTKEVLGNEGFVVRISEVIAFELVDKPGNLDEVLNILANEDISINYIYSFVIRKDKEPLMVIHTDNMENAERILRDNNIVLAD